MLTWYYDTLIAIPLVEPALGNLFATAINLRPGQWKKNVGSSMVHCRKMESLPFLMNGVFCWVSMHFCVHRCIYSVFYGDLSNFRKCLFLNVTFCSKHVDWGAGHDMTFSDSRCRYSLNCVWKLRRYFIPYYVRWIRTATARIPKKQKK